MCINTNILHILASLPPFSICNLVSLECDSIGNLLIKEIVQSVFTLWSPSDSRNAWNTCAAPVDPLDSKLPDCLFVVCKKGKYVWMAIKKYISNK